MLKDVQGSRHPFIIGWELNVSEVIILLQHTATRSNWGSSTLSTHWVELKFLCTFEEVSNVVRLAKSERVDSIPGRLRLSSCHVLVVELTWVRCAYDVRVFSEVVLAEVHLDPLGFVCTLLISLERFGRHPCTSKVKGDPAALFHIIVLILEASSSHVTHFPVRRWRATPSNWTLLSPFLPTCVPNIE